jgi:hypothetical protein
MRSPVYKVSPASCVIVHEAAMGRCMNDVRAGSLASRGRESSGFIGQSGTNARRDGGSSCAAGLAASLVLEGRSELGDERQSRAAPKHLGAKVRGPRIDVVAGDVERRALAQQVALRVQGRIDLVPHVSEDDLLDAIAPLGRPASARAENPAHVAAGILERRKVVVERGDETEVVQHGRDIQHLRVVRDPLQPTQACRPKYERSQWLTSAAEL